MNQQHTVRLFDQISSNYDRANLFISLGLELYWRKRLNGFIKFHDRKILDACCGTGSSSYSVWNASGRQSIVYGIDFSTSMLQEAKRKYAGHKQNLIFLHSDVCSLEFEDNFFDAVTIVFGIRNIAERKKALAEFYRVTKPGGKLLCMEFGYPDKKLISFFYTLYLKFVVVNLGGFISKRKAAYRYLVRSIQNFPSAREFGRLIEQAGYNYLDIVTLTSGVCNIYIAYKD